jgi:adenylate kinase
MLRSISRLVCLFGLVWLLAGAVGAQAAGPLIILIGPPASGKTTQAEILQKERGMTVISVEDLIAQNARMLEKVRRPEIHGVEPRLDPALNRLIDERIRTVDRSKGVILDGYPASKEQGDHVAGLILEFQFSGPIVLQLRLTDADVRKRASQNGTKDVEQGLKDYHRELDFAQTYFPQAHIHAINGARPVPEVAKEIRKVLTSVK